MFFCTAKVQVPYPYSAIYSEVPSLLSEDESVSYTCIENISPALQGGDNVEFTFRYKEAWFSYAPVSERPETDEDGYATKTTSCTLWSNGNGMMYFPAGSNSSISVKGNNTITINRASYSNGGGPGGQYRFEGLIPISLTVNGKKYLLSPKN